MFFPFHFEYSEKSHAKAKPSLYFYLNLLLLRLLQTVWEEEKPKGNPPPPHQSEIARFPDCFRYYLESNSYLLF